jgi:hypothetical protein
VSAVSKVETLGYPDLTEEEKQFLEAFFDAAEMLPVSQPVITQQCEVVFGSTRRLLDTRAALADSLVEYSKQLLIR